jgi:Ca-activated chloride channel family protein
MLRHNGFHAGSMAVVSLALLLLGQPKMSAQFKKMDPAPVPSTGTKQSQPPVEPESAPQPLTTFSVGVNLVHILATVHDEDGAVITHLNRGDFQLSVDGVPQRVSVFERNTSLPLSVAVLIDTSASTRIDIHYEEESVLKFIPALLSAGNSSDAFALYSFNWRTSLEADFSRNPHRAERALHSLKGEGGTSLYDAIYLASDNLADREGRHVIVVVTDGNDTTSYKHFGDALKAVQRADIVVYPIVAVPIENDAGREVGGEHALATLAAASGGHIFYPEGFSQLDEAFSDILKDLRTQYLLGFYPASLGQTPGAYHPISVTVTQPNLKVISRSGYYEP